MTTTVASPSATYSDVRGCLAAAAEIREILAGFDINALIAGDGTVVVDLDTAGMTRLDARIYRLSAANLLGLDRFHRRSREWRGTWHGIDVAVRGYIPRRSFRGWLRDLIEARS